MTDHITPQEAQDLLDGATEGPWEWRKNERNRQTDIPDRNYDSLGNENRHALETTDSDEYASWVIASEEDQALMAAAPDLAATIAADTIEYCKEARHVYDGRKGEWDPIQWRDTKEEAELDTVWWFIPRGDSIEYRIVARRVSPTWEVTNADV